MRAILITGTICCFLGALVASAWADDSKEARAIVDRAVQAAGGKEKLLQFKAATWKAKGKFHGLGKPMDFAGSWAVQAPEQLHSVVEGELNGQKFRRGLVINGERGWTILDDVVDELGPKALAEEKELLHANWVATLVPLVQHPVELTPLGELRIGRDKTIGVRVASAGHRDVNLRFDQRTALLLKSEFHAMNTRNGLDILQEVFYGGYQEIDGVLRPSHISVHVNDKLYLEGEIRDFKAHPNLEDRVFEKPR